MKRFENIKIMPYEELMDNPKGLSFHRGGPIWPNWNEELSLRQCRNKKPLDHEPLVSDTTMFEIVEEPMYWCGPIVRHFGHQLADFSQRLPMYDSTKKDYYFAFSSSSRFNINNINDIPQFFKEILEWFHIPLDKVKIITKPSIARQLVCIEQQEQLKKILPTKAYLDILGSFQHKNNLMFNKKEGTYYVSRVAMPRGKIAGESYLEYILGRSGVKVIRPESISLKEQLRIYASAKNLIFAEGSALHTLQLLSEKSVNNVYVLNRRKGASLAVDLLSVRCKNLTYYDIGENIHGLRFTGEPAPEIGITVANSEILKKIFKDIGLNIHHWSDNLFNALIQNDISIWLEDEKKSPRGNIPGSIETILKQIAQWEKTCA